MRGSVVIAVVSAFGFAGAAFAEGDPAKGERVFKKCKACHEIGDGAANKVGPVLTGVVGRTAGTVDGFDYSGALIEKADGGLVWDEQALDTFLTKPKDFIPGTKMTFAGLRKEAERSNLIAYLSGF